MLAGGPGELANTIIHELTHGTIFIPDSMTYNENLATFIGNRGALNYLKSKYGAESEEYVNYQFRKSDSQLFTRYIVQAANQLDSLYQEIIEENDSNKEMYKSEFIDKIILNMDTLSLKDPQRYQGYFDNYRPNNAYFISFLNYRERQNEFKHLLEDSLENKLSSFISYWRLNYEK
jgi:predicted aminopeptidase